MTFNRLVVALFVGIVVFFAQVAMADGKFLVWKLKHGDSSRKSDSVVARFPTIEEAIADATRRNNSNKDSEVIYNAQEEEEADSPVGTIIAKAVEKTESNLKNTKKVASAAGEKIPKAGDVLGEYKQNVQNAYAGAAALKSGLTKFQTDGTKKLFDELDNLLKKQSELSGELFLAKQSVGKESSNKDSDPKKNADTGKNSGQSNSTASPTPVTSIRKNDNGSSANPRTPRPIADIRKEQQDHHQKVRAMVARIIKEGQSQSPLEQKLIGRWESRRFNDKVYSANTTERHFLNIHTINPNGTGSVQAFFIDGGTKKETGSGTIAWKTTTDGISMQITWTDRQKMFNVLIRDVNDDWFNGETKVK